MRYTILLAPILAGALGWAVADEPKSSFQKSEEQSVPTSTTVSGTVVSTSGHNLAIETQAGNRMDFELGSASALPAGIETGNQINVSYAPGETGVSRVIEVTRVGAAPPGSVATTPAGGELAATPNADVGRSVATPAVAVPFKSSEVAPRMPVAQEATRSQPIRHESTETNTSLPARMFIGALVLGAVVAVGLFLRQKS